jgi:hypothetical protein
LRISNTVVAENAVGVRIANVSAFDPDGDTISWTSSDPRFSVRGTEVFVVAALDYETIPQHQVLVRLTARDNGTPSLSATLDVAIRVTDVNEFFPILASQTYSIPDGATAGTLVGRMQAVDNDTAQVIRYRLHSGETSAFTLNELTGELRLANQANYDIHPSHKVFIEAYDNGTPSFQSVAQIVVDVVPQNLFAPTIDEGQLLRFAENLPGGTSVGQIVAADADETPLIFGLVGVEGGSTDWIHVDPATGVVRVTAANRFDFESGTEYAINVVVTEDAAEARSTTARIPIELSNANDPPTAVGSLIVYPQRQGAEVTSEFVIEDQDPSASGYTVTTTDLRFEVRNGRLALRPDQVVTSSQVGSVLTVSVLVVDNLDPTSRATLNVPVLVEAAATWQNPLNAFDVNRDGNVTALDVLLIINRLNTVGGTSSLPVVRTFEQLGAPDVDVSGDNLLSPLDALRIVNYLNNRGLEGESYLPAVPPAPLNAVDPASWFLAFSEIEEENPRRRLR